MNKLISATAMTLLLAAPTQAAPFTVFIYEDQSQLDLRPGTDSASQAYWASLIEVRAGYPVPGMMMMMSN